MSNLAVESVADKTPVKQADVFQLQSMFKKLPQAETKVRHHFSDGMYARELLIPKGTCVVGKMHRTRHFYSVVKGECTIASVHEKEDIKAPFLGETLPRTKRAIYAHTDCIWITYHPTELTDLAEIEAALIEPDDSVDDHAEFKKEYNITDEMEKTVLEINSDLDLSEIEGVELGSSSIHGVGVFAKGFQEGDIIGYARLDGNRTILGRYTNHAKNCNAEPVMDKGNVILIAKKDMRHEEITVDYRDMLAMNETLRVNL
ncbi:MAG: SET domain-containing protein-lysine N-methyltransferase [Porticoccaceae bacterium]|nr:SET domain-containing protein-lysine N-methyltransferase [Porticoccaceae bacterium]